MPYQKTNWQTGMVITREAMNRIENQLADLTTERDDARKSSTLGGNFTSTKERLDAAEEAMLDYIKDFKVNDGYLVPINGRDEEQDPLGPFAGSGGGGGGGGSNNIVTTMTNTTGWNTTTVSKGSVCNVMFDWTSLENVGNDSYVETGPGTLKITVNNIEKAFINLSQGTTTLNLAPYLSSGRNIVVLKAYDSQDNWKSLRFTINVVELTISSTFKGSNVQSSDLTFYYSVVGGTGLDKYAHFKINGIEVENSPVLISTPDSESFTIARYPTGTYTLTAYVTAEIQGQEVTSNILTYQVMFSDDDNFQPIISCSTASTSYPQYSFIPLKYQVYTPNSATSDIKIYVNDELDSELTGIDMNEKTFSYRANTAGALTFKITTGEENTNTYAEKTLTVTITASDINVNATTTGLGLYFNSYGHSNHDSNPSKWTSTVNDDTVEAQLTNFTFVDGGPDGWQLDSSNATVLRIAGNARVTIPYYIFSGDNFSVNGKTIEIEFSTSNVMNYDTTIISSWYTPGGGNDSNSIGLKITPQKATFRSQQTEIFTQFKENEHVRLSFVISSLDQKRIIYCFINGVMSGAIVYPNDDIFTQPNNNRYYLTIGSNYCTTDIYNIRVYNNALTRQQVLNNWIADTQDGALLVDRYNHNNIFDENLISLEKLPLDLPYIIFNSNNLPTYKGDKKKVSGIFVDPTNPARSFSFENADIDVQGTSSQYYARKNFKLKLNKETGITMTSTGETQKKFEVIPGSIPVRIICFKADVASSEGANNVELAMEYDDTCPYKTPAQQANPKVRQGVEGFPIVIFQNDGTKTTFIGKYNFNVDKGAEDYFGFDEGDESWEILNNTSNRVVFKTSDYLLPGVNKKGETVPAWTLDFEARYPDLDTPYGTGANAAEEYAQLKEFTDWVVSTNRAAATGNALPSPVTYLVATTNVEQEVDPETGEISYIVTYGNTEVEFTHDTAEYRLAKFRNELADYVEIDSATFYYIFTELFLLMDNRAKNMFPSFIGSAIE